jgi:hypothetical protein
MLTSFSLPDYPPAPIYPGGLVGAESRHRDARRRDDPRPGGAARLHGRVLRGPGRPRAGRGRLRPGHGPGSAQRAGRVIPSVRIRERSVLGLSPSVAAAWPSRRSSSRRSRARAGLWARSTPSRRSRAGWPAAPRADGPSGSSRRSVEPVERMSRPFDHVLELADVAGPHVGDERLHRAPRHPLDGAPELGLPAAQTRSLCRFDVSVGREAEHLPRDRIVGGH